MSKYRYSRSLRWMGHLLKYLMLFFAAFCTGCLLSSIVIPPAIVVEVVQWGLLWFGRATAMIAGMMTIVAVQESMRD